MFGRKLRQKIKELEQTIKFLTIDRDAIEKASRKQAERYREDLKRLDEEKAKNEELINDNRALSYEVDELKYRLKRADQKRDSKGRFVKKDPEKYEPKDGDVIAVDCDGGFRGKSLIGILRGKLGRGNDGFPIYVGLSYSGLLRIDQTFGLNSPYRYATQKEKQKLFSALKKEGLKWNPETKTLDKIEKEFKVGGKVKIVDGFEPEKHRDVLPKYQISFTEGMDQFIGEIGTIIQITYTGSIEVYFEKDGAINYEYAPEWLEHVQL